MEVGIATGSLAVAVIAAVIAIWQGVMSRRQLKLAEGSVQKQLQIAEDTQRKTETALSEIRDLTRENKAIAEDIKSSIEERITRILDARLEKDKGDQEVGNQFAQMLMSSMLNGAGGQPVLPQQSQAQPGKPRQ